METYTLDDKVTKLLDQVAEELGRLPEEERADALFDATRYLEQKTFPENAQNGVGEPRRNWIVRIFMYEGDDIETAFRIDPHPLAKKGKYDQGTPTSGELCIQVGPPEECVWIRTSGGQRFKWCG